METVPVVSLQRTLNILLIVYGLCICTAFLAGATLVAHVDPYSECLLYSYSDGSNLNYGSEAYCETIGYLYLACIIGSIVMFYLTYKHRRALTEFYKSGQYMKTNDDVMKLKKKFISLHLTGTTLVLILTAALTAGYVSACNSLEHVVNGDLVSKLNSGNDQQERIDEKFVYDNQFWRYTGQINNAFGSELYSIRITCRTIFTDPFLHQKLHDAHVQKYSSYYGYWYKEDLYSFNPQAQAVLANALIEASMAGGWLSVLLWFGSLVFMLIQKFYLRKEKREMDRVSLHSAFDGTIRKEEMSMISGSFGGANFQRGGLRGSDRSLRSTRSRREVDDMVLSLHGVSSLQNGVQTPSYQPDYAPSGQTNGAYPVNGTYPSYPSNTTYPTHDPYPSQSHGQPYPTQPQSNTLRSGRFTQSRPASQSETVYVEREHVETEIM